MVCRQFWVKSQSDDQRYKYISTVKKLASLGIIVTAATVKHHHYKKSVVTKLLEPPLKRTYRFDRLSTWLDQRKIQVGCSFKQTNALNSIICIIFSLGTAAHQFTLLWQLLRLLIYTRAPHSFTHRHTDTPARSCKVNGYCYWLEYIGFTLFHDGFWGGAGTLIVKAAGRVEQRVSGEFCCVASPLEDGQGQADAGTSHKQCINVYCCFYPYHFVPVLVDCDKIERGCQIFLHLIPSFFHHFIFL